MSSPWALLANATLIFHRTSLTTIDEATGNEIPVLQPPYTIRAYFKKASLLRSTGNTGVPVGSYEVRGYTVGILPPWCKQWPQSVVNCSIDALGTGKLYLEAEILVVDPKIEEAGEGSSVRGYFTGEGQ